MKITARTLLSTAAKFLALTAALLVLQGIGAQFVATTGDAGAPAPSGRLLAAVIGVLLVQTIALAYPVMRSRWHGWRLAATIFVVYFGTVTALSQIESMVYLGDHMSPGMLRGIVLMGLFTAVTFSPIVVVALGRWRRRREDDDSPIGARLSGTTRVSRLLTGSGVFMAFYFVFGYFVAWRNPVLREYYGGTDPGTFLGQMSTIVRETPWMVPFQAARGFVWVLLAIPVIRMMKGNWWEAGLALSLLFAAPALYLLLPNPIMPAAVRLTHLVETAPYQFAFGWFIAWLLTRAPGPTLASPHQQANKV